MISVQDGVRSLVDKSLLRTSTGCQDEPRFSLFGLIRNYAMQRLVESGELSLLRDAHAAYYLALAESASSLTSAMQSLSGGLEWEAENMCVAQQWLLERKKREEALRLGAALERLLSLSENLFAGPDFCEDALEFSKLNVRAAASRLQAVERYERNEEAIPTALHREDTKLYRRNEAGHATSYSMKHVEGPLQAHSNSPAAFHAGTTEALSQSLFTGLTVREVEVLRLLARGMSNKQIAGCLVISPHTVNVHIHSIFSKLDVHSRSAATRYALDHRLA